MTKPGSLGRQEYWHIGDTQARPGTSSERSVGGLKIIGGIPAILPSSVPDAR